MKSDIAYVVAKCPNWEHVKVDNQKQRGMN